MRRAISAASAKMPMYRVAPVQETARGVSIPAPIEGWDAITPIARMPETRAITLDNFFPQPGYIELRKGHARHNTVTGAAAVESMMPYNAPDRANDKLFAAAGTAIYDVTVEVTATTSTPAVSALGNARWQHINIATTGGNFLWICNGVDAPRQYNGSAWATASITGITATSVIQAALHKKRLWLTRANQISPAYLNTDAIQGTATVFDLVGLFKRGGSLAAIGSWSVDGGAGPEDLLAFLTTKGEVAVYDGTDPASNFVLKGVYDMGPPLGRRCLTKVGADLAVVSVDGVLPLSRALITDRAAAVTQSITKLIQPVMAQSARDYGDNFGWELCPYPRGTRAILNVPINENTEQQQYVMNTVTGAWCRFKGENANCWAVFQDRLFFGGNAGIIYEADVQGFDEGAAIEYDCETAFNYCGSQGRLKQFTMARALLTTDGKVSPGMALNIDFARGAPVDVITSTAEQAALWDVALWDGGTWPQVIKIVTDWNTVSGMGYAASIRMAGAVEAASGTDESQTITMQLNGWDMQVLDGAFL